MKNIVVFDEYREIDLKPSGLIKEYIDLTREDVAKFFLKSKSLEECLCPACFSNRFEPAFKKLGLSYCSCQSCHTLFISPRPDEKTINEFYHAAPSRVFWREELSNATKKKRDEKIIKPRFQWIVESTQEYFPAAKHFADINTNQWGYLEELAHAENFSRKTLINPFVKIPKLKDIDGGHVWEAPWWEVDLKDAVDVISVFEVADRSAQPDVLFKKIKEMLRPQGLVFLTAIVATGFDIQVLWDQAENLYPPDRMNVFSVEGLRALVDRHGFECIELSTPGVLDVEIVARAVKDDSKIELPRFVKSLLSRKDVEVRRAFQEFLQTGLMSSYCRVVLRKKGSST